MNGAGRHAARLYPGRHIFFRKISYLRRRMDERPMDSSQENDDTAYRSASLFNSRSLLPFPVAPQRLNSRLTEND